MLNRKSAAEALPAPQQSLLFSKMEEVRVDRAHCPKSGPDGANPDFSHKRTFLKSLEAAQFPAKPRVRPKSTPDSGTDTPCGQRFQLSDFGRRRPTRFGKVMNHARSQRLQFMNAGQNSIHISLLRKYFQLESCLIAGSGSQQW